MNNLQIFNNAEFGSIRTVTINNEPWFVGKDVAEVLGYSNSRKALADHVDDEDKLQGDGVTICDSMGRKQNPVLINESGLYSLILSSKLPSAKKFKHWVTSEVLPSVRKYGAYMTENVLEKALTSPDFLIQLATKLKEEQEQNKKLLADNSQLHKELGVKEQIIGELKPKADYTDLILKSKATVTITQIAKDYGMSGQQMNKILHELGVQYKESGQWLLYKKYQDKGYTHSETIDITLSDGRSDVKMNTKWLQKGRLFLYELLKKNGHLPMIEQNNSL